VTTPAQSPTSVSKKVSRTSLTQSVKAVLIRVVGILGINVNEKYLKMFGR